MSPHRPAAAPGPDARASRVIRRCPRDVNAVVEAGIAGVADQGGEGRDKCPSWESRSCRYGGLPSPARRRDRLGPGRPRRPVHAGRRRAMARSRHSPRRLMHRSTVCAACGRRHRSRAGDHLGGPGADGGPIRSDGCGTTARVRRRRRWPRIARDERARVGQDHGERAAAGRCRSPAPEAAPGRLGPNGRCDEPMTSGVVRRTARTTRNRGSRPPILNAFNSVV